MKKRYYYFLFEEGSKINQIICAILVNLPVFAYGASIGWVSPMTLLLKSDDSPRPTKLTDTEISWMAAAAYIVCVPANILMGYLGDRFGRKPSLLLISSAALGCWITKLASMETWAFIFARSLVGLNMAGCYVTCPLYTKEISEDSVRGVLGSLIILFHTTGNLFLFVIGDIVSYNTILWICLAMPALHIILFLMMPESPSYLVKKGKLYEAAKALAWLRCRDQDDVEIQNELNRLRKEKEKDDENTGFALKAILSDKILFRAFRIALVVSLAREVCGAVPVLNFAGEIFSLASEGTGIILSPNRQAMLLGAVQVAGSAMASSVVEKAGRKPLLFITSLVSGLSMCALASWFLARAYQLYAPDWLPIASLCLCIFCDSLGLQPVSVVVTGEIFSFKYRGTVMAVAMATAAFSDFLQLLFFKPLANAVGIHVAFYFFGAICLLTAIYVILVIPETKMRSVEEIYEKLKTKKERELEKKTSKSVVENT